MAKNVKVAPHWADIYADKIIRNKGEKDLYTCASGITPSGTVHIGNFREIISVDLVVRALRKKGKNVRFIFSWDDYDVFRKVPKNMPEPEKLEHYLRFPITLVPDTTGQAPSYAAKHEEDVESILPVAGVKPEYLYQAARYRRSEYAKWIRLALENREQIRSILNEYRSTPLPEDWYPVSIFSSFTQKDTTTVLDWDGEWGVTYRDDSTGEEETIDLRDTCYAKLPWRIDWPMRWAAEGVDFEPAGKDHHSEGGSFDTSRRVVELFGGEAPVSFMYEFISIKGRGGKISSSSGEVVSLKDVLEIYTPEVMRFMFAGTRPNAQFAISFDLDVLKIYEDYEKCERIYFGILPVSEKKRIQQSRIYELSQVDSVPECEGYQIPFRHLCNLLLINGLDIDAALDSLDDLKEEQRERLEMKARCACNWLKFYAPDDFKFHLTRDDEEILSLEGDQLNCVRDLNALCEKMEGMDSKLFSEKMYACASNNNIETRDFFTLIYRVLIQREKGPKLAEFLRTIGSEKACRILSRY